MATLIYTSFFDDMARGAIDIDTDSFKCLLTTSTYVPNKDTHTKRSDVTNEVSGTGYTTGGTAVTMTITKDTVNDRLDIAISDPSWASSTITARQAVVYKSRGGASSADELVCVADFGSDVTSTNGTFTVDFTTPLRIQN